MTIFSSKIMNGLMSFLCNVPLVIRSHRQVWQLCASDLCYSSLPVCVRVFTEMKGGEGEREFRPICERREGENKRRGGL